MKKDIQPSYGEAVVRCACGETFVTGSTKGELKVEICSKCHPFFTGRQKLVDSGGRVDRFKKRYGMYFHGVSPRPQQKASLPIAREIFFCHRENLIRSSPPFLSSRSNGNLRQSHSCSCNSRRGRLYWTHEEDTVDRHGGHHRLREYG